MRVVREILTAAVGASGRVIDLHAAAFQAEAGAVLIAGARHTGKTTLLSYASTSTDARVIANDRVIVDVANAPAGVQGIPTLVAVRSDTFGFFPALRGGGATGRSTLLRPGEAEAEPDGLSRGSNVRSLSLREFAARLGASNTDSAPLDAVVFPEILAEARTWSVDALTSADGLSRLDSCRYGAGRTPVATVFGRVGGAAEVSTPAVALLGRLNPLVRFFRCRLGPRAYERPVHEWLSAISASSAVGPRVQR